MSSSSEEEDAPPKIPYPTGGLSVHASALPDPDECPYETLDEAVEAIKAVPLKLRSEHYFMHSSAYGAHKETFESLPGREELDYERPELYGDAIQGYCVVLLLRTIYPKLTVGAATEMRDRLVNNKTIGKLSTKLGLPKKLKGSLGQMQVLKKNDTIKAAMFEAYLCGVYDTYGLEKAVQHAWDIFLPIAHYNYYDLRRLSLGGFGSAPPEAKAKWPTKVEDPSPNFDLDLSKPVEKASMGTTASMPLGNWVGLLNEFRDKSRGKIECDFKYGGALGTTHKTEHEMTLSIVDQQGNKRDFTAYALRKVDAKTKCAYQACVYLGISQ